ncbi:MAG: hypothetical protein JWP51_5299 [Bradyrhizobium sp.]|nr:hypothetical protein [Bradyrhizobium sp.]
MPTIATRDEMAGRAEPVIRRALARPVGFAHSGITTAAGIAADGRYSTKRTGYFGYLNSGAAFNASLVVFIDASHLLFLAS